MLIDLSKKILVASLIFYLVFFGLETIFPGLVINIINFNIILIVSLILIITLFIFEQRELKQKQKNKKRRGRVKIDNFGVLGATGFFMTIVLWLTLYRVTFYIKLFLVITSGLIIWLIYKELFYKKMDE